MTPIPDGASGVLGLRWTGESGHDGLAWVGEGPVGFLPLDDGDWDVAFQGLGGLSADVSEETGSISIQPGRTAGPRQTPDQNTTLIRLTLFPVTIIIFAVAMAGLRRAARMEWMFVATAVALLIASVVTWETLHSPGSRILAGGVNFTDPMTSASLMAATADSMLSFSDVSTVFRFPEGHSWLVLGPSWLVYVLFAPLVWLFDAVVAHNVGVTVLMALCGVSAWALAKSMGAGRGAAMLALGGSMLAPAFYSELDKLSLDRACIFLIPLFLLCLNRAAETQGWRWIVAAGTSLAAVFYGQTYYGLYLLVVFPVLAMFRVIGPNPMQRLGRLFMVGVVALVLLLPGLMVLKVGTAGSVYQSDERLLDVVEDWSQPVSPAWAAQYLRQLDDPSNYHRLMNTPRERLMAAVSNSRNIRGVVEPISIFTGKRVYWVLLLLALLLARRRRSVILGGADTLVLMIMALGPLLRTSEYGVGRVLPYYGPFVLIPGFDQLKHPHRYIIMAASISTVPLAIGLEGLLQRLRQTRAWIGAACSVPLLMAMLLIHAKQEPELRPGERAIKTRLWTPLTHDGVQSWYDSYLTLQWDWPKTVEFPRSSALSSLQPGAALLLPIWEPLPEVVYMAALQANLSVVNDPPHGFLSQQEQPGWLEENAFLNAVAWSGGSDRPRHYFGGTPTEADVQRLRAEGLRYIVVFSDELPSAILDDVYGLLDAWLPRIAEDEIVIVWEI